MRCSGSIFTVSISAFTAPPPCGASRRRHPGTGSLGVHCSSGRGPGPRSDGFDPGLRLGVEAGQGLRDPALEAKRCLLGGSGPPRDLDRCRRRGRDGEPFGGRGDAPRADVVRSDFLSAEKSRSSTSRPQKRAGTGTSVNRLNVGAIERPLLTWTSFWSQSGVCRPS